MLFERKKEERKKVTKKERSKERNGEGEKLEKIEQMNNELNYIERGLGHTPRIWSEPFLMVGGTGIFEIHFSHDTPTGIGDFENEISYDTPK